MEYGGGKEIVCATDAWKEIDSEIAALFSQAKKAPTRSAATSE